MNKLFTNLVTVYVIYTLGQAFYGLIFDIPEYSMIAPDPLPPEIEEIQRGEDENSSAEKKANDKDPASEPPRTYYNSTQRLVTLAVIIVFCYIKLGII